MTPLEAIQRARAAIDALEASLTPSKPTKPQTAAKPAKPVQPAVDGQTVVVQGWQVGQTKTGMTWGRLTADTGEQFVAFGEDLVTAMDPLFEGDTVSLELQQFTSRDGKQGVKVLGYSLIARAPASPRDQRDSRDAEIPF